MEKIKKVILIDGEDKTGRIESIQLVRHKGKSYFKIYFRNNIKPYLYGTQRVEVLSFCKELNPIEIEFIENRMGKF
ncbi:hypothetical protein [Streptococcus ruminantium]|uniref:Uncharacterized protein n=1 Tax=Streptococcus ruminantium TaxID=1917441 RepID=A0ABU1B3G3_9STRE|nr:hypothetical protein [Streptococcus ruminantium]MDQ8758748.1 hypothetical protein [Streptococcus ruminantium]MDQ8768529.1 hypothetical protein [Streptococcus ruminantium]MDQ8775081.1 hypothetical protein [Streptococcus ruminantium]MDQ8794217.1 hypothetical protein [Streptococcus ruminantium]MDQ8796069.1 hypothetical protein [Streptococcus ruminantium]